MTILRLRRSPQRRLLALCLLAALAAQMELPAAHAVETSDAAGALPAHATAAPELEIEAARPAPAHDPADCFVCRGLLRANHAAAAPASSEPQGRDAKPALAAAELRPHAAPARSGHPPRAPPAP